MTLTNFREYQKSDAYFEAINDLKYVAGSNDGRTVILCCERDVRACHRRLIGDSLASRGWTMIHL